MRASLYERLYFNIQANKLRDANVKVHIWFNKADRQWKVAMTTTPSPSSRTTLIFACAAIAYYLNTYSHPLKGKSL